MRSVVTVAVVVSNVDPWVQLEMGTQVLLTKYWLAVQLGAGTSVALTRRNCELLLSWLIVMACA